MLTFPQKRRFYFLLSFFAEIHSLCLLSTYTLYTNILFSKNNLKQCKKQISKSPHSLMYCSSQNMDLIHVRGYVPLPAWDVGGTLVPCPNKFNLGCAVLENGNRKCGIPVETKGFQLFDMEWGLGRVRTASGIGLAPSDAVTKMEVDPSTGRFSLWGKKKVRWNLGDDPKNQQ